MAAASGYIDELIEPVETRNRVAWALRSLDQHDDHAGGVLLTGATGFVGMEVLARYLERSERPIVCLVRAGDDAAARERLDGILHNLFGRGADRYRTRVGASPAT